MKIFNINENASIVCEWKKTRSAFMHEANLLINGYSTAKTKICYVNRTWECFEYESVINKLLDISKFFENPEDRKAFLDKCAGREKAEISNKLGFVGAVAKMGEIFHAGDQKASNDWKARMLKAGLQNKGLIMPDDWDTLSEDEKTKRLDGAIGQLTEIE